MDILHEKEVMFVSKKIVARTVALIAAVIGAIGTGMVLVSLFQYQGGILLISPDEFTAKVSLAIGLIAAGMFLLATSWTIEKWQ